MPKGKPKSEPNVQGQINVWVPAIVAISVAVIGCVSGIFGPILLKYFEVKVLVTPVGIMQNAPINTPVSFAPLEPVDTHALGMVEAPTPGIYVSKGSTNSGLLSYAAYLSSGTQIPAESKICLINNGYPPPERRPLNLSAHSISFETSIYLDANGKLTITGYQIFVEHNPINEGVQKLEILNGAAGGGGSVFATLNLPVLNMSSPIQSVYKQEMNWLDLYKGEGVTLSIPIELSSDGEYTIQAKFSLIFTSQDPNVESKQLTLTTGQSVYSWLLINDPRSYNSSAGDYPVNLVKCP